MKITKEQVLETSKGMLQKQVYVVFSTPTKGIGPVMENLATHSEHQASIANPPHEDPFRQYAWRA